MAIALLLAQSFGAILIYRDQAERRAIMIVHVAAFRLLSGLRPDDPASIGPYRPALFPGVRRSFRVERIARLSILPDDVVEPELADMLLRLLADQDYHADKVIVVRRSVPSDPAIAYGKRLNQPNPIRRGSLMLVAVHRPGETGWTLVRVKTSSNPFFLVASLFAQTLLIYLVIVGAIALIVRRMTQPLGALTKRVERFAETRQHDAPMAPGGPNDIRCLIEVQNNMEWRILALLSEKDVMLGAIGHDLKTRLAALRVRIESVESDTERRKMAMTIEDIVRTLDDILSLARVHQPTDPIEISELSALVASIAEEYEDTGEAVLLAELPRIALPLRAAWVRRALRKLVDNALRYGVSAHISLTWQAGFAVVRIDDEGPGIKVEDIAPLWEPFIRGEPSRNSESGGAGLGLTLARAIAQQHGGELELRNRKCADGAITGLRAELRLPLS